MSYHTTAPWDKSQQPPFYEKSPRQQSQFPSKYTHLPHITSNSPQPIDSQLVPLNVGSDAKLRLRMRSNGNLEMDVDDRIREVEMRLGVSEKSNRALLEEVLRLQNELKTSGRRSDDLLREERKARLDVETSIKSCSDLISQLTVRIKTTEEKVHEEKMTLSTLVNHTKGVEQAVLSSQQDLLSKKAVQSTKLHELQSEVSSTIQAKNKLETLTYQLSDEIHQLKTKVDSQGAEYQNVTGDLKARSKRLEEENRSQRLDTMRKQTEAHSTTDTQIMQLKGQVESRLSELRDVMVEARNKQENETTERRNLEQHFQSRVNDLYQNLGEQNRKREESLHAVDIAIREKEHMAQTERMTLTSKVSDTVEEMNKKLLAKEIKIRDELQDRFIQLEKLIQEEQHLRREQEKTIVDNNEKRWNTFQKAQEDELYAVKDGLKSEKEKSKGTLQKLDESITILERQQQENKKQIDKVMTAEIQSRKIHEKNTAEHLSNLNEKLQVATSTLQQAIGGINTQVANQLDKVRREVKSMQGDQQQAVMRSMTDLDARIVSQSKKITTMEEMLDAKVTAATTAINKSLREKIESISLWQDTTAQTIRELKHGLQSLPQDVYALEEKHKLLKAEIDSRMSAEADMRTQEMEMAKYEIEFLKNRKIPHAPTIQDMEMLQSTVRKMADSMQTVKTVLGMKIQSEQKLRISGLEDLQAQLNQLKVKAGVNPIFGSQADYLRPDLYTGFDEDNRRGATTNRSMEKNSLSPTKSIFGPERYKKPGPPKSPLVFPDESSPRKDRKEASPPAVWENSPHQSPAVPSPDPSNRNKSVTIDWTDSPPQSPQGPQSRVGMVSPIRGLKSVTPTGSVGQRSKQRSRQSIQRRSRQSQPQNGTSPTSAGPRPSPTHSPAIGMKNAV